MKIVTRHTSNAAGRGQVIAKGNGKQRTISWDHSKSADWNHGAAAGTLAVALVGKHTGPDADQVVSTAIHTVNDDGSHTFNLTGGFF